MIRDYIRSALRRYTDSPLPIKATVWFVMCTFLQKGVSTITTPIFTRLLTPAEYGQVTVFNSWYGVVSVFVTLNLSSGIYMQGLVKHDKERDTYSSALQGLTLASVCVWVLVYALARDFWNKLFSMTTIQTILMLVMCWTSAAFGFWAAEQRVVYKYKKLAFVTLAVTVSGPIMSILLMYFSADKVTAKIAGPVLVEIVGYGGCFIAQFKRGKKLYVCKFWKHAVILAIPLIPHYLSQTVLSSADRIMIEKYVGKAQAGVYGLAYSVSQVMTVFQGALMQAISPWIYTKIKERHLREIADISYPSLVGVAFINILLIACAPEVVALFAPKSYYSAIWIIPPVAMSTFFGFAYDLFAKFQFYFEKTGWIMVASAAAAVLNVILNAVFIQLYGYYAAGYTTLICYVVYTCGHYFFMKKLCRFYFDGEKVFSSKPLIIITAVFLLVGFMFMAAYTVLWLRYILLAAMLVFVLLFRKLIVNHATEVFAKLKD